MLENAGEMRENSGSTKVLVAPPCPSPVPVVRGDHDMAVSKSSKSSRTPDLGRVLLAFRLADAAAAWNAARLEALCLKEERDGTFCESELAYHEALKAYSESDWTQSTPEPPTPCWKNREDGVLTDEQCAGCTKRYEIHRQMKAANVVRGARLRVLQRLAAQFGNSPKQGDRS
jgi:hypothetical protein